MNSNNPSLINTFEQKLIRVKGHDMPFRLYASDLPDFVYCKRLFYMKKTMDFPRVETFPMLRGTIEHEIRRTLAKGLRAEYESCKNIDSLKLLDYKSIIESSLDYGRELARKTRAQYYLQLEEIRPILRYRLLIEESKRLEKAIRMTRKGIKFEHVLEELLPWESEIGVGSSKFGITGRVDQVFKIGNSLIPIDFKTHVRRIAALMLRESHFEQLVVYGLLLEIKYPGHSVNKGIIKYTEDNHDEKFNITAKSKKNVIEHIKEAKQLVKTHQLPPKLTGDESVKCSSCYLKQFCFSLEGGSENC